MQSFASKSMRYFTAVALLSLALLLALPMPVGAEDGVFTSIRVYDGLDPDDTDELYRLTAEGFLQIIRDSEGFIGYYWLHSGRIVLAISLFETEEQASASNDAASDYVAEHLAGLVPNPPLIVEGTVHIGFVEMLDVMGNGDVSSLYTSVRLYDEFETDNLDHFVSTVEDGFLPLMRETDGFFGYYLMDNGAGALAAISIFDSEASALASNEKARDFVTENLTAYLPNDPSITSGQLEVAALAAVNDGANLIDDMMDDSVFVSMRVYDGVDPIYHDEIVRLADEGFLPIMRESEGFVGYYLLLAGDMLAAISLFDTAEEASASNEAARDFVAENLAPYAAERAANRRRHCGCEHANLHQFRSHDDAGRNGAAALRRPAHLRGRGHVRSGRVQQSGGDDIAAGSNGGRRSIQLLLHERRYRNGRRVQRLR